MTTVATEETTTVTLVTPISTPSQTVAPNQAVATSGGGITPIVTSPNVKRHVQLYRYGIQPQTKIQTLNRLLGKKCWKEIQAIIYDDSTLKIFEDPKCRGDTISFEIKLEDVALYLAFGKAALKYSPPPITTDELNFISINNLIAIPESTDREKVHWFAARDEFHLKDFVQSVAETIDGKLNPPQLGKGPKYRYSNLNENENKWFAYWIACAQKDPLQPQENFDEIENGTGNGNKRSSATFVATPLVAILEKEKLDRQLSDKEKNIEIQKNGHPEKIDEKKVVEVKSENVENVEKSSESDKEKEKEKKSPTIKAKIFDKLKFKQGTPKAEQPREPPRDYYKIDCEIPDDKIGILKFDSENGAKLIEDEEIEKTKISVRLSNGKRIKEIQSPNSKKEEEIEKKEELKREKSNSIENPKVILEGEERQVIEPTLEPVPQQLLFQAEGLHEIEASVDQEEEIVTSSMAFTITNSIGDDQKTTMFAKQTPTFQESSTSVVAAVH